MYSVVLMMSLSAGAEAPDCHRSRGCHGCSGAYCSGWGRCSGRCHGGCGGYVGAGYGCSGGCYGPGGVMPGPGFRGPGNPEVVPPPTKDKDKDKDKVPMKSAYIKVTLPADAVLMVDGQPTTSTSPTRSFVTPPLESGGIYTYSLRAEFVDKGLRRIETQAVHVRAGQETLVRFGVDAGVLSATK